MPVIDPTLTPPPKIKLTRLRDVGWSIWDPIGLIEADQKWYDDDCVSFANEYDSYLIQAAERLRRGEPATDVARYLATIEVEHMGLGGQFKGALVRAEKVVAAIQTDSELWTYPDQ